MPDVVRMGVVGAGNVSQRGILPHLSQDDVQDRVHLAAVVDTMPGRAEAAAAKYNVDRAFTDYEDMLANGDIDAVTIASPIGLHFEQGRAALQAGKHIHFNKTMTTTADEATELIDLARSKGLKIVASPGEMSRPHNQVIKQLIADGAIGTLTWAICGAAFGRYHEEEEFRGGTDVLTNIDPSWYFRKPGGGPMYDMTVYALHGLTGILGPAKRVTAMSGTRIKEREFGGKMVPTDADDNTFVLVDFGDNLVAVAYGAAAGGVTRGFGGTYFGTKGSIVGMTLNGEPIEWPGRELGPQNALPHVVGPHREIGEAHVYEDIMQLVDWIRDDKPSVATAEHARHVIEIIEAGYRASETGQAQDLKTTF
jgi:predicted dehydrogenase